jgi:YD repeat-containing protein
VKQIKHLSGLSTNYSYEGDKLSKLQVEYQGSRAEYLFSKDGLVQSRDLLGGVVEYAYTDGKLTSAKLGQYGEAKYVYDDQSRLREIHFPDGSRIEYRYEEGKGRGRKSASSQMQTLTVVRHPASEQAKGQHRQ